MESAFVRSKKIPRHASQQSDPQNARVGMLIT